jgi:hypothetical protein
MGNKRIINIVIWFIALLFFVFPNTQTYAQISLHFTNTVVIENDSMLVSIENLSNKSGVYNLQLQLYERKKWRMMTFNVFTPDTPFISLYYPIKSKTDINRKFVLNYLFTGTFKKYKQLPGRLVLTYSYSDELEPKEVVYSKKFIVKNKSK